MTSEEIRQEAEEHCNEVMCTVCENKTCTERIKCREWRDRRAGYYCGAESRENKIADIKANCDLAIEGRDIKIKELEKENAELKAKNKWYSEQVCNKECAEVWRNLTEAKEHIKQLLDCLKQDTNDPETNYYVCQYMDKAEQFLKDNEFAERNEKSIEIIKRLKSLIEDVCDINYLSKNNTKLLEETEQFLKECK